MSGNAHAHSAHGLPSGRVLGLATALTLAFAAVEAGVGWWAGSLALVADAGHMVSDAGSLALAAAAAWVAKRATSRLHSYGLGRVEFLAALINSLGLLALVAWLVFSAIERLRAPQAVLGEAVSATALVGLGINLMVAWLLNRGGKNLNIRAALLHVMGDLLGSVAALVAGLVILWTNWTPIDPLLSLLIGALLVVSSLRLLREALHGLMEGVPLHLSLPEIGQAMAATEGVVSVHDLHVWSLSGERVALSAHVVVPDLDAWPELLPRLRTQLADGFHVEHVTLQPEIAGPPPPLVSIGSGSGREGTGR
jgi:cobalt-zinc-cadmium efflux system protein